MTPIIEEFQIPESLKEKGIIRIAKEGQTIVIQWQDRPIRFDIFKTWKLTVKALRHATKDMLSEEVIERLELFLSEKYIEILEGESSLQSPNQSDVRQEPIELTDDLTKEVTFQDIGEVLSTSIKRDYSPKLITFSGMLLAQTKEDQLNIGFQSESSAGKSYIPIELASYFPKDEVSILASASPTAFFHDRGVWDKEKKTLVVDVDGKILVFLDQPHFQLLERLRPLLSHDMRELQYKITDKNQKQGLRTKNVTVRGYPSVIFCTTKMDPDEQEKTRMILLSPSIEQEKLKEAIRLMSLRKGNPEEYHEHIHEDPRRKWLTDRIRAIRQTGIRNVIIPNHEKDVCERFLKEHPYLMPRHQRDFPRIMSLIKAHALLNCFKRQRINEDTIIANQTDINTGFELYRSIQLSNELGLSPYVFRIYMEVFVPLLSQDVGVRREEIQKQYHAVFHKTLSPETLKREIIPQLETVGLIVQEPDPEDKRRMLIYPTISTPIISKQTKSIEESSNRGIDSGVTDSKQSRLNVEISEVAIKYCPHGCNKAYATEEQVLEHCREVHPEIIDDLRERPDG